MHSQTTNHVHQKYIFSMHESFESCLNPFLHTPLPTLLSHSLAQSGPAPHRAAATLLLFRSIYSIRYGEQSHTVEKVQYSLFHATREQRTVSQWVNGFMIILESSKSPLLFLLYGKKGIMQLPQKQIKESDHHSIQRKEGQTAQ